MEELGLPVSAEALRSHRLSSGKQPAFTHWQSRSWRLHFKEKAPMQNQSATPVSPAQDSEGIAAATDPVIAHIRGQLDPAGRAPMAQDDADDFDDVVQGPPMHGRKTPGNALLKKIIGRRLIAARELNGWSQGEAAKRLGFTNGTQLNLWETGNRLPPLHSIPDISATFGVSVDFLMGLDDEPERDSSAAARNAVVRRMSVMLERHAGAVADVLLAAGRFDPVPQMRASQVVSTVAALCNAVERFRGLNSKMFDDARAGAMLLRTARDAREAIDKVDGLLDASDRRVEFALKQGRNALLAPVPESLPAGF